jgi:hypothetical protein
LEGDPRKLGVHRLEEKLKAEAKGARGLPKCPTHLKGLARKAWRFLSEEPAHMKSRLQVELQYLAPRNSGRFPISEGALREITNFLSLVDPSVWMEGFQAEHRLAEWAVGLLVSMSYFSITNLSG